MYIDPESRIPYGHNHAVYSCECGQIIDQCPCQSDDKEHIVFDTCWHDTTKYHSWNKRVFSVRPGRPEPTTVVEDLVRL